MNRIRVKFEKSCLKNSKKIAFIFYKNFEIKKKTFQDLYFDVLKLEVSLRKRGLKKGNRILVFIPPSYELVILILASIKLGISVMYVDLWASKNIIAETLEKYPVDYIAVSKKTRFLRLFFASFGKIKKLIFVDNILNEKIELPNEVERENIPEDTIAILTMTSGSTGKPKIVSRSHSDLYNQLELINKNMEELDENNIVLTTAFMYSFSNILKGFTTVLPQISLKYPFIIFSKLKLKKFKNIAITSILTTPDFALNVKNIFKDLKSLYIGGAILNYNEVNRILNNYKSIDIKYIYGATECNIITKTDLLDYKNSLEKLGIAELGRAVNGVFLKIGSNKEIFVNSEALLRGNISLNTIFFDEKDNKYWHNTGDVGYVKDGKLYYLGRNDVNYIENSIKIYSNPIEQKIVIKFPQIEKCAFFNHNNRNYLFLNSRKKIEIEEVIKYLKIIGNFDDIVVNTKIKIPCDIKHHSKIDYNRLKEIVGRKTCKYEQDK